MSAQAASSQSAPVPAAEARANPNTTDTLQAPPQLQEECLTCRIIGTGALAATGVYALNMSRAHAPGSPLGKRIMAGVGVGFLVASVFRWTK